MAGWRHNLCDSLWEHCQSQELIDFQIVHQNGSMGAHKIVLSASCVYFRALTTTCQMSDHSIPLTLPFPVNQNSLVEYLSFLYRGQCSLLSFDTISGILDLADATCVDALLEEIVTHISQLDSACVLPYLSVLLRLSGIHSHQLDKIVLMFSCHFQHSTTAMIECDDSTVISLLLNSQYLHVDSEADVLETVLKWVEYDHEQRLPSLATLLLSVRWPQISDIHSSLQKLQLTLTPHTRNPVTSLLVEQITQICHLCTVLNPPAACDQIFRDLVELAAQDITLFDALRTMWNTPHKVIFMLCVKLISI